MYIVYLRTSALINDCEQTDRRVQKSTHTQTQSVFIIQSYKDSCNTAAGGEVLSLPLSSDSVLPELDAFFLSLGPRSIPWTTLDSISISEVSASSSLATARTPWYHSLVCRCISMRASCTSCECVWWVGWMSVCVWWMSVCVCVVGGG